MELFESLDLAAKETTTVLAHAGIRHAFIGGYATSLLGGMRLTNDVDAIVDADPSDARAVLLQAHRGFELSRSNKLVFISGTKRIPIELLRGGKDRQLRLPDASIVDILFITASTISQPGRIDNIPIPIVAPSVLILTKIKRWSSLAESTRPQTIKKAENDVHDIQVQLDWLAQNNIYINLEGYPEKPKDDLLSAVRMLYQIHATIRPLLETTLKAEDFGFINS